MSAKINKNGKKYPIGIIPNGYPASNIKLADGTNVEEAIGKTILKNDTYTYEGILSGSGTSPSSGTMIVYFPFDLTDKTVTCDYFRPAGQTAIVDTAPSIYKRVNQVVITSSVSGFTTYIGKLATANITIAD